MQCILQLPGSKRDGESPVSTLRVPPLKCALRLYSCPTLASNADLSERSESVPSRVKLRTTGRPVDIRLESLHSIRISLDLFPFGCLLDTPVDHISERRKLVDLFLELWKCVRVSIRREGVTHRACHPSVGKCHAKSFLGGLIAVEEQVTDLDLLHEDLLECLELLRRVLGLMSKGQIWS